MDFTRFSPSSGVLYEAERGACGAVLFSFSLTFFYSVSLTRVLLQLIQFIESIIDCPWFELIRENEMSGILWNS